MFKPAILLLAHGSRNEGAVAEMVQIAENYRDAHPEKAVYHAFEEFAEPSLESACKELAERYQKVVIVPLYLTQGRHLTASLPDKMASLKKQYPHVEFIMAAHIGADKRLSDIIEDRVQKMME